MPQMARRPFMESTMIQRGGGRQEPQKSRFDREFDPPAQVNHFLRIPPILAPHPPPPPGVPHAIDFSASDLWSAFRCLRRVGRHSHLHHRQPGRWLWRRPVSCEGRKMRRARRTVLLPLTEFCTGDILPSGRSGRNHRIGAQRERELQAFGMRRVHRHHVPALSCRTFGSRNRGPILPGSGSKMPLPRKRRDADPRSG